MWIEEDAATLQRRLAQHIHDLALSSSREGRTPSLRQIVNSTGRAEYDKKKRLKGYDVQAISPQLAGDLARSVLVGSAYPQSLLATMIRRIRSDGETSFDRVSAIKAVLVRNSRLAGRPLEVSMELNEQEGDIAYRCGRLFAVLEKAQADGLGGELNATVKDRYFSSATTTPALIFPRLFRLNCYHLAKLSAGTKIYYERLVADIMAAPFTFPKQLRLAEQGQFVIGYFQQRQALYTRKDKTPATEVPSE
jgi:CRISPR-associated protein Csd1